MPSDVAATPSVRIQIRARGPSGQKILDLPSFARVSDLKAAIRSKFELEAFQIRIGHPSTILELPADETALADLPMRIVRETLTVAAAPVEVPAAAASANGGRYGDEGVVRRSASPGAQRQPQPAGTPPPPRSVVPGTGDSAHWTPGFFSQHPSPPHRPQSPPSVVAGSTTSPTRRATRRDHPPGYREAQDLPEVELPDRNALLVPRIMPDDNSCLFRAFSYAITPPDLPNDQPTPHDLRSLVKTIILADPDTYNSAILEGKEPATYCAEMMSPDKWGGAIELGILSKHFDVRVDTIDVESGAVLSFHEAAPTRAILIYSGIHYDTVAQTPFRDAPGEVDRRLWEVGDGVVLEGARELCGILRAQSYFTNTESFGLVCTAGGCGWVGQGWKEAGAHSKRTGHGGFDQIQ